MKRAILNQQAYEPQEYMSEADFEREVVANAKEIFGEDSLYIDVKRRIGKDNIVTIPDGYLLDFSFASEPRLYIIENELSSHDPYRHIGQQLLRFAISYRLSGRRIKKFLLREIMKTAESRKFVSTRFEKAGFRNIDAFLEDVIFEKDVAAIVVIDEADADLENVLTQLNPFVAEGNAFFPDKCLGHGCAKWVFQSCVAFADEFYKRLEMTPQFKYSRDLLTLV